MTSHGVRRSGRHFMKSFWVKFGWAKARSMAEACRAEVGFFVAYCFLLRFSVVCLFTCMLVLFCRRHRRWRPRVVLIEATAMKAPSPAVEATTLRAPSPTVEVPRPREPTPTPADPEV